MSRLPSLTAREVIAALKKAGFKEIRQRGSHLHLWHPVRERLVTVPAHARELPRGTLKSIVRQSDLAEDEFNDLL
ncbi:MAG: type II toxin-antitoxin system HicA family toxin [Candidatus Hydrogenedentes bacterium]|nr:type II toxin-antitoxin system HicA family toxin [Candidatus Hydrogenedentota bacterium]